MENSITKSFAWSAVDRFSNLAIQFILGIIIARLITPEEYGVLGILMVFINISQVFIDSGLGSALIYKNKIDNDYLSTSFVFNLGVSVLLFLILFLFAPFIESFFSLSGLSDYIRVSSLVLITNSLIVVPTSILQIQLNFRALAISNMLSTIVSGILGVIFAYLEYGVWALIVQLMSKSLFLFSLLYIICHWVPKLYFNKNVFNELYRYGINIFSASCLTKIVDEGTSFFIGKFLTPFSLGVYTKGRQFAVLPGNSIGGIISSALFPFLSSIKNNETRFNNIYYKVIEIQSFLCIPVFVWLAVMADPLVRLLLTEKWIAVVPVIQILGLGRLLSVAANVIEQVLNSKGHSDIFFQQQIWKMFLKAVIIFGCLPFGLIALVVGESFFTMLVFFTTNYLARKYVSFSCFAQLKVITPYIICALICGSVTLWLNSLIVHLYLKILIGSIAFVALYFIVLISIQRKDSMVRWLFQLMKARTREIVHNRFSHIFV